MDQLGNINAILVILCSENRLVIPLSCHRFLCISTRTMSFDFTWFIDSQIEQHHAKCIHAKLNPTLASMHICLPSQAVFPTPYCSSTCKGNCFYSSLVQGLEIDIIHVKFSLVLFKELTSVMSKHWLQRGKMDIVLLS